MNASFFETRAELANLEGDVFMDRVNFCVSFSPLSLMSVLMLIFFFNQTLYLVNKKKPHRIRIKTAVFAVGVAVPLFILEYVITVPHL